MRGLFYFDYKLLIVSAFFSYRTIYVQYLKFSVMFLFTFKLNRQNIYVRKYFWEFFQGFSPSFSK